MADQGEKVHYLPCRIGEITFWNPALTLWVYRAGLFENTAETEILDRVRSETATRDGTFLNSLPARPPERRLSYSGGFLRYVPQSTARYIVDLSGSFDEYMQGFAAKTRSTLRRKVRKFARESDGMLDLREYRTPDELAAFFPLARLVSSRSYQELMLDAGLPDDSDFQESAVASAAEGRCRGYLLCCAGQPTAYLYVPIRNGVGAYAYVGYDQALKRLSPGTVLLLNAIERLFADPDVHTFDFTEGGEPGDHKALFANASLDRVNCFLLRPTPRNIAVVAVHAGSRSVSRALVRALDRLGIKNRVRLAVRRLRSAS